MSTNNYKGTGDSISPKSFSASSSMTNNGCKTASQSLSYISIEEPNGNVCGSTNSSQSSSSPRTNTPTCDFTSVFQNNMQSSLTSTTSECYYDSDFSIDSYRRPLPHSCTTASPPK